MNAEQKAEALNRLAQAAHVFAQKWTCSPDIDESLRDLLGAAKRFDNDDSELTGTAAGIERVCDGVKRMLLAKNAAYGDSALSPLRVFSRAAPDEALCVRMDDKLSRLARGHALSDESLTDTEVDLLGYIVLHLVSKGWEGPVSR